MTGAEALKHWREVRNVSQYELAVAVGVTNGAISQYERAVHTPRRRVAKLIDEHLDADGAVLEAFGYSGARPGAVGGGTPAATADEVNSLRAELARERSERRSEVGELRDQVEELIDQVGALTAAVDDLRRRGAGSSSPRSASD